MTQSSSRINLESIYSMKNFCPYSICQKWRKQLSYLGINCTRNTLHKSPIVTKEKPQQFSILNPEKNKLNYTKCQTTLSVHRFNKDYDGCKSCMLRPILGLLFSTLKIGRGREVQQGICDSKLHLSPGGMKVTRIGILWWEFFYQFVMATRAHSVVKICNKQPVGRRGNLSRN